MRISLVIDCTDPDRLVRFWETAMNYTLSQTLEDYRILLPASGQPVGPPLILQPVPESKAGKNRVHIDVHPEDAAAHITVLEALGGHRLGERVDAFGIWWQTMTDPEGNEFCVVSGAESPPNS
jgi:predicted enzyme related to lactoylglutathione lyase